MKKIILAASVILSVATMSVASAQENKTEKKEMNKEARKLRKTSDQGDVNLAVKTQFEQDFPGATNAVFVQAKSYAIVSFKDGTKMKKAYYDFNNQLIGTTQKKTFAEIPPTAQAEIKKRYPGYTVTNVIKYDDNENNDTDMVIYDLPFSDSDNFFVELKSGTSDKIVKVDLSGDVSLFKDIS
ncbi:MAG: hypothetical protein ABWZ25_18740 [Chitinophagaceae bacterium]